MIYLSCWIKRGRPWLERPLVGVLGPVVFAGFEVLRARWPLSGFGWGDLATAHVDGSWMLTSARVLGGDGLTLLTALIGGTVARPTDRMNESGGLLIEGAIVAQGSAVAKGLQPSDPATNNNLSRPVGVVSEAGGIAAAMTGEIATIDGDEVEVAMVAGLVPALGDEVFVA